MIDAAHERKLQAMNSGRLVSAAWGQISPAFEAQKLAVYAAMLGDFRTGKDPAALYHHVATLAAIDDLESRIRTQVRQGEIAAKELRNGPKDEDERPDSGGRAH